MTSQITCNLTIGESFVRMEAPGKGRPLAIMQVGELNENEHAAASAILEVLRALNTGQKITRYFNPSKKKETIMIKCQWSRHGYLKIKEDPAPKKYQHALTIEEAMNRHRNFTCDKTLYEDLPKKRFSYEHESSELDEGF